MQCEESCGIFVKRNDGKIVTTVHKSSFHNVPPKNEIDNWVSGAMNVHPPGKDRMGAGLVAYRHTHMEWRIKKGESFFRHMNFYNTWRATYA